MLRLGASLKDSSLFSRSSVRLFEVTSKLRELLYKLSALFLFAKVYPELRSLFEEDPYG